MPHATLADDYLCTAQEIAEFVARLIQQPDRDPQDERRTESRHKIALTVRVQPLDSELKPIGGSFSAVTRDLSNNGIALFHQKEVQSPYLGVELTDPDGRRLRAAFEVLRCRLVGPYFEIAGKFVAKVYQPHAAAPPPHIARSPEHPGSPRDAARRESG